METKLKISDIIKEAVEQVENSDEGLRCKLLGVTHYPFYVDINNHIGVSAVERSVIGDFIVYTVYIDAVVFKCKQYIFEDINDYSYMLKIISNQKGLSKVTVSGRDLLYFEQGVDLTYNLWSGRLVGESLLNLMHTKSSLNFKNDVVVYYQDMAYKDMVNSILVLVFLAEGLITGNLKLHLGSNSISLWFLCRFKSSLDNLINQLYNLILSLETFSVYIKDKKVQYRLYVCIDITIWNRNYESKFLELVNMNNFFDDFRYSCA